MTPPVRSLILMRLGKPVGQGGIQAISRDGVGVFAKAILDAVNNPKSVIDQAERGVKYVGEHATVILNKAQKVISTWAHDISSWRIRP